MLKTLWRRFGDGPNYTMVHGRRLVALLTVLLPVALLLFLAQPHRGVAHAAFLSDGDAPTDGDAPAAIFGWAHPAMRPDLAADAQIFNDDLLVTAGQRLTGDIVVYSGDATVAEGGAIDGNLIVYSGDIDVERGGMVTGHVTAFSGDVDVAGRIGGDLAAASGDITLDESASIGGDVSVLSGEIVQETGAVVGGSVVRGPNFQFTLPNRVSPLHGVFNPLFGAPFGSDRADAARFNADRPGPERGSTWGERLARLVVSLIVAGIATVGVVLLCGLLTLVWPGYVGTLSENVQRQLPLSFAVGLLANLSLLVLIVLLTVLLCTAPLAFVLALGALGVNLVGWTSLGALVGQRVTGYVGVSVQAVATTALGALIVAAPLALLFALGGCLRFFALLAFLLLSSTGAGAALMDLLPRVSNRNQPPSFGTAT